MERTIMRKRYKSRINSRLVAKIKWKEQKWTKIEAWICERLINDIHQVIGQTTTRIIYCSDHGHSYTYWIWTCRWNRKVMVTRLDPNTYIKEASWFNKASRLEIRAWYTGLGHDNVPWPVYVEAKVMVTS